MSQSKYACPCCGYLTLAEVPPGTFLCCEVCYWEDDPVQFADEMYEGGANKPSLQQARNNFRQIGASEAGLKRFVRAPRPEEVPDFNEH